MVVKHSIKDHLLSLSSSSTITLPACKENMLEIIFKESDVKEVPTVYNGKEMPLPFAASNVFNAEVSSWRRLTADDEGCKPVYEVTLDVSGSNFTFKPGDTIGIIPLNNASEVDQIINHLDLSGKAGLEYNLSVNRSQKGGKIPSHIPNKSTIRHVLTHCCDIRSILKKLFILTLSRYTKEDNEKRALEYLCSKEGSTAYNTHILNRHFCILDMFSNFKSCKPPIEILLANLPRLLPRPYSIVNSELLESNLIKICFSVSQLKNNRKGLVTGWLERLITSENSNIEDKMKNLNIEDYSYKSTVPIYLRKNISGFSMPEDLETPLILIGPGTGISPFIGFLQERQYLKEKCPEINLGDTWVFFGCRNPKLDFIYENELNEFLNNGTLIKLSTSFSRVEDSETKYIQDAILKNGEDVVKLIKAGAVIRVCGDLCKMAAEVKETLVSCFVKHGGKSQTEAETLLSDLQTGKRYLVDAWS